MQEVDYSRLAHVVPGLLRQQCLVLKPKDTLIIETFWFLGDPNNSAASLCAHYLAQRSSGSTTSHAHDLSLVDKSYHALDGRTNVIVVDINDRERVIALELELLERFMVQDKFETGTRFAFLQISSWGNSRIVPAALQCIRELMVSHLRAEEVLEPRMVDYNVTSLTDYHNSFTRAINNVWRGLAKPMEVFLCARDNPKFAYATFGRDVGLQEHLRGAEGEIYRAFVLKRDGDVFIAPSNQNVEYVAIKRVNLIAADTQRNAGAPGDPYRQTYYLQTLGDNKNVPRLHGALEIGNHLYIVTPWANGGNLESHIPKTINELSSAKARGWYYQILRILRFLQGKGLCHHDIKPSNFIIHDGRLMLIDFSMAFPISPGGIYQHFVTTPQGRLRLRFGTDAFMPPEHYQYDPYNALDYDFWSGNCCLLALATGIRVPWDIPDGRSFWYSYMMRCVSSNNDAVTEMETWLERKIESSILLCNISDLFCFENMQMEMYDRKNRFAKVADDIKNVLQSTLSHYPQDRKTLTDIVKAKIDSTQENGTVTEHMG